MRRWIPRRENGIRPGRGFRASSVRLSTPEGFNLNVLELLTIYETLPGDANKDLVIYKTFNRGEGIYAIRQAVASPTLEFVFALPEFFHDNTSWNTDIHQSTLLGGRPSEPALQREQCRCRGLPHTDHLGQAQGRSPTPFLWRAMRLDKYQRFLKKRVCDFDGMGVYYFLSPHISPRASLHFGAYIEQ